jgi:hypothetical protein
MVWYIRQDGSLERKDTVYCARTRTVSFTTTHLSLYVIGNAVNPFADMTAGDWFYDAAMYSYAAGLIGGMTPDTFGADTALTRGMVVTILYRHAGQPRITGGATSFRDVAAGAWYADAVRWAQTTGVILGHSDGTFRPADYMTREQLAAVLYRYADSLGLGLSAAGTVYADRESINVFARESVGALTAAGVFRDIAGDVFNPLSHITRAEAVSALFRLLTAGE